MQCSSLAGKGLCLNIVLLLVAIVDARFVVGSSLAVDKLVAYYLL